MYRKDNESLTHIISEGKKHAPEALSDAIADMCIGISGRVAHAEEFDRKEVHILAVCMSHMITAKEKAQSALNNIFEFYQISDQYGLYDAALDAFIAHPELQTDQAILGRGVGNWSFDQISTLVNKLKN